MSAELFVAIVAVIGFAIGAAIWARCERYVRTRKGIIMVSCIGVVLIFGVLSPNPRYSVNGINGGLVFKILARHRHSFAFLGTYPHVRIRGAIVPDGFGVGSMELVL